MSHSERVLTPPGTGQLSDSEQPEQSPNDTIDTAAARESVHEALLTQQNTSEPITALNASPLGEPLHEPIVSELPQMAPPLLPVDPATLIPLPAPPPNGPALASVFPGTPVVDPEEAGKPAPPPVPPPMIPPA